MSQRIHCGTAYQEVQEHPVLNKKQVKGRWRRRQGEFRAVQKPRKNDHSLFCQTNHIFYNLQPTFFLQANLNAAEIYCDSICNDVDKGWWGPGVVSEGDYSRATMVANSDISDR